MNKENKCPRCNRPIPECHCKARVDIIGTKSPKSNKPNYDIDPSGYDFEHWCKCGLALGITKVVTIQ